MEDIIFYLIAFVIPIIFALRPEKSHYGKDNKNNKCNDDEGEGHYKDVFTFKMEGKRYTYINGKIVDNDEDKLSF